MTKTTIASATASSRNTFKDLGIPHSDQAKTKSDLALAIHRTVQGSRLSRKETASIMGVDQAKVSAISRGITKGYSVDRLLGFLNRLGMDVDIRLKPKAVQRSLAHTRVIDMR